MRPLIRCVLIVVVVALAACSSGDDGDDGAGLGNTSSTAPPEAPTVPEASAPGTGIVVIGEIPSTFAVTACTLTPGSDAGSELVHLTGTGTRANGVPFSVEVVRASTEQADETFTDLITYTDTARILQVQRTETGGEVTDLRDPEARATLLRLRPDGLGATGIAGPPGTRAPEGPGLVGLALDATCE